METTTEKKQKGYVYTGGYGRRYQLNITWGHGNREIFQEKFDIWNKMQARGKGSVQKFIMWLLEQANIEQLAQ